jgi:hypothetical protein
MKRFVCAAAAAFAVSVLAAEIVTANPSDKQTSDPARNTAENGSDVSVPNADPKQPKESKTAKVNVDDKGIILKGYDVVAYFKQRKSVEGNPAIESTYQGPNTFLTRQRTRLILTAIRQSTLRSTAHFAPTE